MAPPTNARFTDWPRAKRFDAAVKAVMDREWSQTRAAAEYGVSRQRLNLRIKGARELLERQAEAIELGEAQPQPVGLGPLGLQEKRRFPATFQEFDDHYFSHLICPDCGVNHKRKPFHDEMVDMVLDPDVRRGLINVPPFHAKSTYATVKTSLFRVGQNPNYRRIIISASQSFAESFLVSIDQLLTNDDLYAPGRNFIDDWGPFKDESTSIWNKKQIFVAGRMTAEKDPTILVLGVGNQIYGRRADEVILDDIADTKNQATPDQVEKMRGYLDKMVSSRVGKSGRMIYIGTRVSSGDIYSILKLREGYRVITYPCVLDDTDQVTLWPEHFPYAQAMTHRSEMSAVDFQLVYQNVDIPGLGASFDPEVLELCKDKNRTVGHYESGWRLVAGLDPAGGNAGSGYTAFTLMGVDMRTGNRFLIDQVAVKAMKAPQLRDQMFDWTDRYPISEWRVESNGLQSQVVQYNEEIIRYLARKGVRVVPHFTHNNKWDPQFGVESTATLFNAQMVSIPWGNANAAQTFQPFIEQLVAFPMGSVTDRVMSFWFADLGCRDYLQRGHLPMFSARMKVPRRIARRRHVVDFSTGETRQVPIAEQRRGAMAMGQYGYRRSVVGRPVPHGDVEEFPAPDPVKLTNVGGFIDPETMELV